MLSGPRKMKRVSCLDSAFGLSVAEHVGGDPLADVRGGSDAVDHLLHLAVAPVAALDRVGGGRQQRIIQERQGFFEVGRKQFVQRLAETLEAGHAPSEPGQFGQGGVGPAAAVKEAIRLVYNLAQDSQGRQAAGDPPQVLLLGGRQVMLNQQVAMLKQVGDLLFDAFLPGGQSAVGPRGPTPAELGQLCLQSPTDLGDGLENGFREFRQDVELADLMLDRTEHLDDGLRIQRRAVGRDAPKGQPSGGQGLLESCEKPEDVFFGRVVIEDLVKEPLEVVVIDDRKDAVRPVVQLVGGDVAGEVG